MYRVCAKDFPEPHPGPKLTPGADAAGGDPQLPAIIGTENGCLLKRTGWASFLFGNWELHRGVRKSRCRFYNIGDRQTPQAKWPPARW